MNIETNPEKLDPVSPISENQNQPVEVNKSLDPENSDTQPTSSENRNLDSIIGLPDSENQIDQTQSLEHRSQVSEHQIVLDPKHVSAVIEMASKIQQAENINADESRRLAAFYLADQKSNNQMFAQTRKLRDQIGGYKDTPNIRVLKYFDLIINQ